ncbi:MAG: LrgB family protein [Magnetospirillum sp.]|nr:LrgB family protein [Magnetospirillum sp.]
MQAFLHLRDHPLTAIMVTVITFLAGEMLQRCLRGNALANPVIFSIIVVNLYLLSVGQDYFSYLKNASPIQLMLGPATVALAVPLYRHMALIRKAWAWALLPTCAIVFSAAAFAALMLWQGGGRELALASLPRSVTTPVALALAGPLEVSSSLVVFFVFATGLSGVLFGVPLLRLFGIRSEQATGLSLGLTCHALGVMRALQISEKCAVFAVLGMGLMAAAGALLIPLVARHL